MINWQSILSSFDDKPTLLEWLKKVQKALNESALTTVTVAQEKAGRVNSITLSFNFQDGTKIVAPAFTVQDGKDGTGITDLIDTNLTERDIEVMYDTTYGLRVYATQRSTYLNGKHTNTLEFRLPIMPGNGIIIDKKENAEEVEIKIDTSGFPLKIYRHLLLCSDSGNTNTYNISLYSLKSDAITTDYVLAHDTCLIGAISSVLDNNNGSVSFDRLITASSPGPEGYFGISASGAVPPLEYVKIISDNFEPL